MARSRMREKPQSTSDRILSGLRPLACILSASLSSSPVSALLDLA